MALKPLRGRVLVKEIRHVDGRAVKRGADGGLVTDAGLHVPPSIYDNLKAGAGRSNIHFGRVLAIGAPQLTKRGAEAPIAFAVGDEVLFVYAIATEEWRTVSLAEEDLVFVSHEEVQAVITRDA